MTMREKHIRNFIIGGLFALLALFWTGKHPGSPPRDLTIARYGVLIL